AVAELCRTGSHRDGECATDQRDARGTGAADRNRGGVAGHQLIARRSRPGVRGDAGEGDATMRRGLRPNVHLRREAVPYGSNAWCWPPLYGPSEPIAGFQLAPFFTGLSISRKAQV